MSTYDRYYDVVRRIPPGRVSTYGTVAGLAGMPGRARQVGYALAALAEDDVPWHRVVNARGEISARRGGTGHAEKIQRRLLEREGIRLDASGRIDLEAFGWP